jgi:hypothetical protein
MLPGGFMGDVMNRRDNSDDWHKNSRTLLEHSRLTARAVDEYRRNHPGESVDITAAQEELAERLGKPRDYFRLRSTGNSREDIVRDVNGRLKCPRCGAPLRFDAATGCPRANPNEYTGLFSCSLDGCFYHAYTRDGLLDVRQKVRAGKAGSIEIREGLI